MGGKSLGYSCGGCKRAASTSVWLTFLAHQRTSTPGSPVGIDQFPVAQDGGGTVLVRRAVMERDQAIALYRLASSEDFRTPIPSATHEVESVYDG
jgi:hypothetical protein